MRQTTQGMNHQLRALCLLPFLLLLPFANRAQQSPAPVNVDSLRLAIDQNPVHDTLWLDQLKGLVNILFTQDPPLALEYSLRHQAVADSLGDIRRMARSHNMVGNVYKVIGLTGKAIPQFMEALRLYDQLGDQLWLANIHSNLGNVYEVEGRIDDALKEQLIALEIRQKAGLYQGIDGILGSIGNAHGQSDRHQEALQYYQAAVDTAIRQGNGIWAAMYYGNMGNVYGRMKDFPKALEATHKALAIHQQAGDKVSAVRVMHNIGQMHMLSGKFDSALHYQLAAFEGAERLGMLPVMQPAARQLVYLFDTLNQHQQATEWARLQMRLSDSLSRQQQAQEARDAEMRYRLEIEEQERAHRAETNAIEAMADKRRQKVLMIALSAGLALTLALAVVLLILFSQKRRAGRVLETKVEQRTQQLSRANHQLEQEVGAKEKARVELREFIYRSSHDLKGPLTSIQGLVQVASAHEANPYLPMIHQKVDKLDRVLQQLIDKAELENHKVQMQPIQLQQWLLEIPALLKGMEKADKVQWQWEVDLDTPVQADPFLLRLAIKQIMMNAVDFSAEGASVTVRAAGKAREWSITVADQGHGMDEEVMARAGELFFRGTAESKGAGLGLYLAKEALGMMGMTLQIQSASGGGTSVTLLPRLPAA